MQISIRLGPRSVGARRCQRATTANMLAAVVLSSATWLLSGCQTTESPKPTLMHMANDTKDLVSKAARAKVFFNHQSVGANILAGVKDIARATDTEWTVTELTQGASQWPQSPGIWHATFGQNGEPKTKIDAFAQTLRSFSGGRPQIAMMKLCFVDVTAHTDIEDLLSYYANTVNSIKRDFPELALVHVTVPLATRENSLKARAKRAIGLTVSTDASNLVRTKYNRRLRELFPNDAVWDLEAIESTQPDGSKVEYLVEDEKALGLALEYASDPWGHLNAVGGQKAAVELARVVATRAPLVQ